MTPYSYWCENLENVQITLAVKGLNFTDHCGALSVKQDIDPLCLTMQNSHIFAIYVQC